MTRAILDDHLLRDLLADDIPTGLEEILAAHEPATTNHYLFRLCKSVVSAAGGALTGAWSAEQRRALGSQLLALPADVEVHLLPTGDPEPARWMSLTRPHSPASG